MSGMQLATGGLALVQAIPRVATGIIQTYKLCQEIKEAPTEIIDLVEELKSYESIFVEIETQFHEGSVSDGLQQSFEQSKRAHANLEELAKELRSELESKKGIRRRLAPIQVVLRKSTLERLEKRLARCVRILQLSVNAYQMAMIKLSPDIIARKVASDIMTQFRQPSSRNIIVKEYHNEQKSGIIAPNGRNITTGTNLPIGPPRNSIYGRFGLKYTKATGAWQAQIQLPSWWSQSIYEVVSAPAMSGWNYSYRVYNTIPRDSEIITRVQNGDMPGVIELFRARKASPFDKDDRGHSLLYYATDSRSFEICEMLLHMGLQCVLDERVGLYGPAPLVNVARGIVGENVERDSNTADPELGKIVELFQRHLREHDEIPAERLLDFVHESIYDHMVTVFRGLFMPQYYRSPLRDRLEAVRLGTFNVLDGGSLLRLLSQDGSLTSSDVSNSTLERLSLVHSAAIGLGSRYPEALVPYRKPWVWVHVYTHEWDDFVTDTVKLAAAEDLHGIEFIVPWDVYEVPAWRGTPLTSVIGGALCYLNPGISLYYWDSMFHDCLRRWLTLIQAAGVDLVQYGQEELRILHDVHHNTKGAFDSDAIAHSRCVPRRKMLGHRRLTLERSRDECKQGGDLYWVPFRIIDFKIGPNPDDWLILWAPEFEHMACQFWQLVEIEEIAIPGAWVDE